MLYDRVGSTTGTAMSNPRNCSFTDGEAEGDSNPQPFECILLYRYGWVGKERWWNVKMAAGVVMR